MKEDARPGRTIRAALIGCGAVALRGLVPGWLPAGNERRPPPVPFLDFGGTAGLDIVAVVDPADRQRAAARAIFPDAIVGRDYDDVLDRADDVDALVIATPNRFHESLTLDGLSRGLDVFVEKPMAQSREGLAEICRRCDESGQLVMIHLPWRFRPAAHTMRACLDRGLVGTITHVEVEFRNRGPDAWSRDAGWYRQPANVGGCLTDLGPHALDLVLDVIGRSTEISANWQVAVDSVCEHATGLLKVGPATARVVLSWQSPKPVVATTVAGTTGQLHVRLSGPGPGVYLTGDQGAVPDEPDLMSLRGWELIRPVSAPDGEHDPFAHFVSCVRTRRPPRTAPAHARLAEELLLDAATSLRAVNSGRTGQW